MVVRLGLSRASRKALRHQVPGDAWIASEVRARAARPLDYCTDLTNYEGCSCIDGHAGDGAKPNRAVLCRECYVTSWCRQLVAWSRNPLTH